MLYHHPAGLHANKRKGEGKSEECRHSRGGGGGASKERKCRRERDHGKHTVSNVKVNKDEGVTWWSQSVPGVVCVGLAR